MYIHIEHIENMKCIFLYSNKISHQNVNDASVWYNSINRFKSSILIYPVFFFIVFY